MIVIRAVGAVVASGVVVIAAIAGGQWLNEWRNTRAPQPSAESVALAVPTTRPSPSPQPSPSPIRFDLLAASPGYLTLPPRSMASAGDGRHFWAVVTVTPRTAPDTGATALMRSDDGGASWSRVDGVTKDPWHVAASGSTVVVSDPGFLTASTHGSTPSGGLFLSSDSGATWKHVFTDGVLNLRSFTYGGRTLFLGERWWPTNGAASGPSDIYASIDGATWRNIGTVPGPAWFGMLDAPLVSYSKNLPGDGVYRVDGTDLASLRLVPVNGSGHVEGAITAGLANDLWAYAGVTDQVGRSTDGGRTWTVASAGLAGRIAGLFTWKGSLYAIGDGAYRWDGASWQAATMIVAKAQSVWQVGDAVFVYGYDGRLYKAPLV